MPRSNAERTPFCSRPAPTGRKRRPSHHSHIEIFATANTPNEEFRYSTRPGKTGTSLRSPHERSEMRDSLALLQDPGFRFTHPGYTPCRGLTRSRPRATSFTHEHNQIDLHLLRLRPRQ